MHQRVFGGKCETKRVQTRRFVTCFYLFRRMAERFGMEEQQRPEVEVIAKAPRLIVDNRHLTAYSVRQLVAVGIYHSRFAVASRHLHHSFESIQPRLQRSAFERQQYIFGICRMRGDGFHRLSGEEAFGLKLFTAGYFQTAGLRSEHIDFVYQL